MFKKLGVLTMVLAGATFLQPASAVAAEWHNGGGAYGHEHREAVRPGGRERFEENRYREYRAPRYEVRRGYYGAPAAGYYGGTPYGYGYGYAPRCR